MADKINKPHVGNWDGKGKLSKPRFWVMAIDTGKLAQGTTVIHVKDGKPLTAYGAKLLGVPWPLLL